MPETQGSHGKNGVRLPVTPTRARRRAIAITAAACLPAIVVVVWPQLFGLASVLGIAQLIAFRAVVMIALGLLALLALGIAFLLRRRAMANGIVVCVAIALAVASLGNAVVLAGRAITGPSSPGAATVVSWNTLGGGASAPAIAQLVRDTEADVVTLPETDAATAAAVVGILAEDGIAMTAHTAGRDLPTSVLIAAALGDYRLDAGAGTTPGLPSGLWRPVSDASAPVIVAAHPVPPMPGQMSQWRTGLAWVIANCAEPNVIIGGDINATLDHLWPLPAGCADAAATAGVGAAGTWPTTVPSWLGTPIDHVLAGSGWRVVDAAVLTGFDDAGSDHRPIVAELVRASG